MNAETRDATYTPVDHLARVYREGAQKAHETVTLRAVSTQSESKGTTTYPKQAVEKVASTAVVASTFVS